ncbi:hypothetical protein GIV94_11305 [Pseudomonas syringae]|uniref:lipocalin-like domain-containing protein n=1 Tax=Pseudomonas syringae TaxID=317 RepID=UPI001F242B7A|nr:lipocalin-like domain-containing protein [Pseudomonas syringae]MCF5432034.1 hypothetical protein [Pseudomonas syringae]
MVFYEKSESVIFLYCDRFDSVTIRNGKPKRKSIQGVWKLVSYIVEVKNSGEQMTPMGKNPTGSTIFTKEGRTWFMLTADGRKPAENEAQRGELLDTLIAYAGKYRIEGNKWITSVEVAWNPLWVGTEQSREFRVEGNLLHVLTPWRVMPNWIDKGETRSIITFERDDCCR